MRGKPQHPREDGRASGNSGNAEARQWGDRKRFQRARAGFPAKRSCIRNQQTRNDRIDSFNGCRFGVAPHSRPLCLPGNGRHADDSEYCSVGQPTSTIESYARCSASNREDGAALRDWRSGSVSGQRSGQLHDRFYCHSRRRPFDSHCWFTGIGFVWQARGITFSPFNLTHPMRTDLVTGFLLVLLAATMNGAYAIPMKFMPRWKWENIWLVWTVFSLWVLPAILAWAAVPHPIQAYSTTPWTSLLRMGAMGILWGAGVLLLGMSFPLVGVAVGASVALGCAAAVGTLLPIIVSDTPMQRSTGFTILLGVIIVLLGVGICGFAGRAREQQQGTRSATHGQSIRGFIFASVGGTLTAALNLAFVSGATITANVQAQRPSTPLASIAIWMPILLAGAMPGVAYTLFLLMKNSSTGLYRQERTSTYWPLVVVMGALWLGSIVVYGNGVAIIGALGPVVGWPMFMSGAVIASAFWGTLFGEWKNSGKIAKAAMTSGVFCLMIAIIILGKAGH